MSDVERVTDAEVIDFDLAKAKATLRKIESAMDEWIGSTVKLADLAHEAQRDLCWRADDDYRAALASSAIALDANGSHAQTWLGWKFNKASRTIRDLAAYGELRAIIAADRSLPPVAEPEFVTRPMVAKLLNVKLRGSEQRDDAARDDAIREAWRIATTRTDGDIRAAITEVLRPAVLKQIDYRPIRRLAEPKPPTQRGEERRARIAKTAKEFAQRGYDLLNLGAVDKFDAALIELQEARKRWTAM